MQLAVHKFLDVDELTDSFKASPRKQRWWYCKRWWWLWPRLWIFQWWWWWW